MEPIWHPPKFSPSSMREIFVSSSKQLAQNPFLDILVFVNTGGLKTITKQTILFISREREASWTFL